jgi:hypothetical protein
MFSTDAIFPKHFKLVEFQLVELVDVEPTDMEGQLYFLKKQLLLY